MYHKQQLTKTNKGIQNFLPLHQCNVSTVLKQETEEVVQWLSQFPENKSVLKKGTGSTAPGSGVILTEYYDTKTNHMKIAYSK